MHDNTAFRIWMESRTQRAAAQQLGYSQSMVGHWKQGTKAISAETAARIEQRTAGELSRIQLRPDVFGPLPYQLAQ